MKGWNHQFGVIDTIYEEEAEFSSNSSSPSLSPPSVSNSPPLLHSSVKAWSAASGRETDVTIRVQGTCFRLHKDRMTSRSSYMRRQLTEASELTLSPPLNITAETFAAVAQFCYNRNVHLTPNNVAAIRTAAGLLGMTESTGQDGDSLCHVAESYLCRVVGIDRVYASTVLRSCLPLLPEAETTASLVSRCIEALVWENDDRSIDASCLNVVVAMNPQDFQTVADSINTRLSSHDFLYRMIDLYLKENKNGQITEEQKSQICNCIDCVKLSPRVLVECVQNPIMPLRFIVRAMLVEHLNTRRSISAAAAVGSISGAHHHRQEERSSLGDILRRDSARREALQLKEVMDSTSSRIQSLEKELNGMKKILQEHQAEEEEERERKMKVLNAERSASFHVAPAPAAEESKVGRGGRGSVSSSGFVFDGAKRRNQESCNGGSGTPRVTKTLRQRFVNGLKNAFRGPNSASALKNKVGENV